MANPMYRLTIEGKHFRKSSICGYEALYMASNVFILRIYLSGSVVDIVKKNELEFISLVEAFESRLDF